MEISENVLKDIVKQTVSVGDVFLIELDSSNGITPKDGAESRKRLSSPENSLFGKVVQR